jgi:hypothetical protein
VYSVVESFGCLSVRVFTKTAGFAALGFWFFMGEELAGRERSLKKSGLRKKCALTGARCFFTLRASCPEQVDFVGRLPAGPVNQSPPDCPMV